MLCPSRDPANGEEAENLQDVWVAKSGEDPRCWFRPDAPDNKAPWCHGRFPADDLLVPAATIREAKQAIIQRIRAQREWSRSEAALLWQQSRPSRAARYFEERMVRALEIRRSIASLPGTISDPQHLREFNELVREHSHPDILSAIRERWGMTERSLPRGCPFKDRTNHVTPGDHRCSCYRPADSELRYRRYLIRRWLRLDQIERWLARFPEGALDFVHRHETRERRWHLINLWIRVPEGRELFDAIPALAMALASGWCFRGRLEPHLFRSIRRLVRRKRVRILSWLGFPANPSTLKLLKSLPSNMISVPALLGLRRILTEGKFSSAQLLTLENPIDRNLLALLSEPVTPSLQVLRTISAGKPPADLLRRLFRDGSYMAGALGAEDAEQWLQALGRARGLGGLREVHDRITVANRNWQLRQVGLVRELMESGARLKAPLPGSVTISPLDTAQDITDEGEFMHHCLHSYLVGIVGGRYFAYSVNLAGEHATVGMTRTATGSSCYNREDWKIDQIRGPRNQDVSEALRKHVEEWFCLSRQDPHQTPLPNQSQVASQEEQFEFALTG